MRDRRLGAGTFWGRAPISATVPVLIDCLRVFGAGVLIGSIYGTQYWLDL
jgi:hypothetical protein